MAALRSGQSAWPLVEFGNRRRGLIVSTVVDHYLALAPREFPHLRGFTLSETYGVQSVEVDLEMMFAGTGPERLIVRCSDVRDLLFRQPFTSDMKIHALNVRDVTSDGLERIRFEVCDVEQDCLSFKCRTFEAERRRMPLAP